MDTLNNVVVQGGAPNNPAPTPHRAYIGFFKVLCLLICLIKSGIDGIGAIIYLRG